MILLLDEEIQKNPSIILSDNSKVIDFDLANKIPYEIITSKYNIPNDHQNKCDNWYSIMHESYYFKNRTRLQVIINELLGVCLSKYMGFDTVEYELATLNGELIGLLSKNFRKENRKYQCASELTKKDHKKISYYLTVKDSILNLEYKRELYDYIMRTYYAASYDLSFNVLYERIGLLPHISTLFDYERSLTDTEEDSIYDPFVNFYISSKSLLTILNNNPSIKQSIDKVLGFSITKALEDIEEYYNITIPSEVKMKYQEFDTLRKDFIEDKLYQKTIY